MATWKLDRDQLKEVVGAFPPSDEDMRAFGFFMVQQIDDRFESAGASGGESWPPKKSWSWGVNDGRAILTGPSARLRESFDSRVEGGTVIVWSDDPKSAVHQQGTEKYGGPIPTIRPKKAKALFIPLNDHAARSIRMTGPPAALIRAGGKMEAMPEPTDPKGKPVVRARRRHIPGGFETYEPLVKGRLQNGRLQKWDSTVGKYVDGIPDFIFLSKSDIPPRPMLPNGTAEKQAQLEFIRDMTGPGRGIV
jgi:phage gpG-like protein